MTEIHPRIAIVGGGITGAVAASILASAGAEVVCFDQGRRGPGGRASHRSVRCADSSVLADDELPASDSSESYEFDHGCQFTRADSPRMRELVGEWVDRGWVAPWGGRFGSVVDASSTAAVRPTSDFFGLPSSKRPVYVGVGGMHQIPRAVLRASGATVHRGQRVSSIASEGFGWVLRGVSGAAAFHDTAESVASAAAAMGSLAPGTPPFDAVLLTDISSSFGEWHRASAGVPEVIAARIRERVRVPLFSCMIALREPLDDCVDLDGISFRGSDVLWWAARSSSKPGFPQKGHGAAECWTLVSTPAYAVAEITRVPMQDERGVFIPQSDKYLNGEAGPGHDLLAAFQRALAPKLLAAGVERFPEVVYMQAQRWGSALPAPTDEVGDGPSSSSRSSSSTVRLVAGVEYECSDTLGLMPPTEGDGVRPEDEFIADDALRLFYAGDFASRRTPGFEAAALSGRACAEHMLSLASLFPKVK